MDLKIHSIDQIAKILKILSPAKKDKVYLSLNCCNDDFEITIVNEDLTFSVIATNAEDSNLHKNYDLSNLFKTFELDVGSIVNLKNKELKKYELVRDLDELDSNLALVDSSNGSELASYNIAEIDFLRYNLKDRLKGYKSCCKGNDELLVILDLIKASRYHPVIETRNKLCIPNKDFTNVIFLEHFISGSCIIYYPNLVYKYLNKFFRRKVDMDVNLYIHRRANTIDWIGPIAFNNFLITFNIHVNKTQPLYEASALVKRLFSLKSLEEAHICKSEFLTYYGKLTVFETVPYTVHGTRSCNQQT